MGDSAQLAHAGQGPIGHAVSRVQAGVVGALRAAAARLVIGVDPVRDGVGNGQGLEAIHAHLLKRLEQADKHLLRRAVRRRPLARSRRIAQAVEIEATLKVHQFAGQPAPFVQRVGRAGLGPDFLKVVPGHGARGVGVVIQGQGQGGELFGAAQISPALLGYKAVGRASIAEVEVALHGHQQRGAEREHQQGHDQRHTARSPRMAMNRANKSHQGNSAGSA